MLRVADALRAGRFALWAGLACGLVSAVGACRSGARPDFGTLPRVEVPLGSVAEDEALSAEANSAQATGTSGRSSAPTSAPQGLGGAGSSELRERPDGSREALPDPPPLVTRHHIAYTLRFDRGAVEAVEFSTRTTTQPHPTARRLGRFAVELWRGSRLVERVRFDFPLLGASLPGEREPLEAGLTATTEVLVPLAGDASRARIVDRKTGDVFDLHWPPEGVVFPDRD